MNNTRVEVRMIKSFFKRLFQVFILKVFLKLEFLPNKISGKRRLVLAQIRSSKCVFPGYLSYNADPQYDGQVPDLPGICNPEALQVSINDLSGSQLALVSAVRNFPPRAGHFFNVDKSSVQFAVYRSFKWTEEYKRIFENIFIEMYLQKILWKGRNFWRRFYVGICRI